jgi:hypothetical protein
MKTIKKIFVAIVITLIFASCKKSIKDQSVLNTIEILSNHENYNFILVDTVIEKEFNGTDYVFVISMVEYKFFDGTRKKGYTLTQSIDVNSDIAKNNLKSANDEVKEQSKRTGVYTTFDASGNMSNIIRYLRKSTGLKIQIKNKKRIAVS